MVQTLVEGMLKPGLHIPNSVYNNMWLSCRFVVKNDINGIIKLLVWLRTCLLQLYSFCL